MYWTTKDKKTLKIVDMSDGHLLNTIKFIHRNEKSLRSSFENFIWSGLLSCQGEMAELCLERELCMLEDVHWMDLEPKTYVMIEEAKKRGIFQKLPPELIEDIESHLEYEEY